LLFYSVFDYANRGVKVNQKGVKLNFTHELMVHAGDVDIVGRGVRIVRKSTETLKVTNNETGLEVNSEETK
jgi:hypothetical protein